jgi:hypothetical protein
MSRETKAAREARQAATAQLREWIKPGDTVYTILEHVSRSGMRREIRVVLPYVRDDRPPCDGCGHPRHYGKTCAQCTCRRGALLEPVDHAPYPVTIDHLHPNHAISQALGLRQGKHDGLIMGGCGMDMGFALVYELSATLYGHLTCAQCGKYPSGEARTVLYGDDYTGGGRCEYCAEGPLVGGYTCLGKGRCPSNYHVNHRITDAGRPERFDLLHTDGYAIRHRWL